MKPQFENHYQELYRERWESLKNSLSKEMSVGYTMEDVATPVMSLKKHEKGQSPTRLENGLLREYFLDPASILVARALPLFNAEKVLDMCAAPGGKTLVLYSRLRHEAPGAELIANELSNARREALTKVIQHYIPRDQRERIWVKGADGVRYGLTQPETFDAILLDAPCSGEKHLLENKKEMEVWSPQRTKGLAVKQYSLLSSAWSALKPGGYVLYSTCSISPTENDGVIEKLIKKKRNEVRIVPVNLEIEPERTTHGFQYFPDRFGFGPLYGCLIQKSGL